MAPVGLAAPVPQSSSVAQRISPERVLARALIAGDVLAVETWLAETRQTLQRPLELTSHLSLRPISLVLLSTPPDRQEALLTLLLKLGAHFNYQEPDLALKNPLHLALSASSEVQASRLIRLILSYRGRGLIALADATGQTPLAVARERYPALAQSLETFRAIELSPLSLDYQPTAWARGVRQLALFEAEEALFRAVEHLDLDTLKALLTAGVSPHARSLSQDWETPLHQLVRDPRPARMPLLLTLAALALAREAPDFAGSRPLHLAARQGDLTAMEALSGAELEARDHEGKTPLMQAALAGQARAVDWLKQRGALCARRDFAGQTPLQALQALLARSDLEPLLRSRLVLTEALLLPCS
jgi:ankyrin repeat protein